MNVPRIAVVGAGHLGRLHAKTLAAASRSAVVFAGVVDPLESARGTLADQYGVPSYARIEELPESVDAVILAAPSHLHHALGLQLLRAGIDLFVEKPLAMNAVHARELVTTAAKTGRVLQVGHIERFNPAYIAAKPFLRGARYLEIKRVGGYSFRSLDTGVVLDLMIHDLDLMADLMDSPVVHVDAFASAPLGPWEDFAQVRLEFASGCVANLTASRISPEARRTWEAHTESGIVHIDFAARQGERIAIDGGRARHWNPDQLDPATQLQLRNSFFEQVLPRQTLEIAAGDQLAAELDDFLAAIRDRKAAQVSGKDGVRAIELAELVLKSLPIDVSAKVPDTARRAA